MEIDFIGVPLCLGASTRGMEKGPAFMRRCDLATWLNNHRLKDLGDILVEEGLQPVYPDMKNLTSILHTDMALASAVEDSLKNGHFPLVFGGDHSLSWGSITGVLRNYDNPAVIYIDAHGDFNTRETSETHNVHGMHMAYLMHFNDDRWSSYFNKECFLRPSNAHFIGTRSLDEGEIVFSKEHDLDITTTKQCRQLGAEIVALNTVEKLRKKGTSHVHISFDIDAIDPQYAPGTGVPVKDGLLPEDVFCLLSIFLRELPVVSMDIVEYNPSLDKDEKTFHICQETLRIINNNLS